MLISLGLGWKGDIVRYIKVFLLRVFFKRGLSPKTCQCLYHHSDLIYQPKDNLSPNGDFLRPSRNIGTNWGLKGRNWCRGPRTRLVLGHDHAGSLGRGVPAGGCGAHEEEACAHHCLVFLHHRRAGRWAGVTKTFLKSINGYSQVWCIRYVPFTF